ncbi:MAG: DNA-formamidopyrimidine glycosylase [Propionibacterium sp.]|nr:MAG: DNA-formamidopyrimidine glycosylase [Propionibacterium sp.]
MPELPEVEVIRQGLLSRLPQRTIDQTSVFHHRPVRSYPGGATEFIAEINGRVITDIRRRGKYLWWVLDDTDALLVHLGMSGQFRFNDPTDEKHKHTRVVFKLDSGEEVRFLDQRMFGGFTFIADGAELPVPHIAPDPFDPSYEQDQVVARLRKKRSTVKRALLDQRLVSGIGNIYADESLWQARLHYDYPTNRLTKAKANQLLDAVKQVMAAALESGGTSFDALYVNVNGESGYFARELNAYGREGLPCLRCGEEIKREHFMNRSSFRCPSCQRTPKVVTL